jgi:hypothetical protein
MVNRGGATGGDRIGSHGDGQVIVTLDPAEALMASYVGCRRRVASLARGCQDRHGYDGKNAWQIDIEGALAELAVAKALDLHWGGTVNAWKRADLGRNYQIRTTVYPAGKLIVRALDAIDDVYILVVQINPLTFKVVGQINGLEARQTQWWTRPDPQRPGCWAIPQSALSEVVR